MIDEKKEEVKDEVIEEVKEEAIEEEVIEEAKEEEVKEEETPKKREIISREGVMTLLGYDSNEELTERDEALIKETYWRFNRVVID